MRDVIAYEVLTYWLRRNKLSSDTRTALITQLTPRLADGEGSAGDPHAVVRAFAALILSELVRADALDPIMSPEELGVLSKAALQMFEAERDYRGLDEELGWIHTIAHGADLMFRLAAHKGTNKAQHEHYLAALRQQVARDDVPAYVFNEADRLGRVASTVTTRGLLRQEQFDAWVISLADPGSLVKWHNAFRSPQGMARLHNVKQFLRALREQLTNAEQNHAVTVVNSQLRKLP